MPKGVLWRQEDIFFAAMGGGGWGAAAHHPPRRARRPAQPRRRGPAVMLVVAPLMHGNAQWVMWNAFMMAGTAVLYTEHHYDPDRLWRLIGEERVVSIGLVGDAMARPLAEALAGAPPGTVRHLVTAGHRVGRGHALLDGQERAAGSSSPNVMIMDRFGSSESGAQGAVGGRGHRAQVRDERRHRRSSTTTCAP